ncbi:MAG: tRNA (adenosine(37)-N6)-dimethylallyltransferase MiaA [Bacteroidota bacterium]
MPHPPAPLPLIVGPTAVGKTAYGLALAKPGTHEIISADSRQIYRPLTIGTAKPSPAELAHVPHHFINEKSLDEPFSAGRFAEEAEARIAEILARGRTPLILGGSTLYVQALVKGIAQVPPVPAAIRHQVHNELTERGAEALYRELQHVDPVVASSMDATKTQRVVRALEVYRATGTPLSIFQAEQTLPAFTYRGTLLHRPRPELYDRINQRVDHMLADGLLEEVRALYQQGYTRQQTPALRTIGYQEPLRFLQGDIDYNEMVRLLKRNSRRYAKRQITWYKRYEFAITDLSVSVTGDRPPT